MLPRFAPAHRFRPVALVRDERTSGFRAPYVAIEASPAPGAPRVRLDLLGPGGARLSALYDATRRTLSLDVVPTSGAMPETHRSRRFGSLDEAPHEIALTLTGRWLCAWSRARPDSAWEARARHALTPGFEPRTPAFLRDLRATVDDPDTVSTWRSGTFGQLGLRDLHVVTHADGTAYEQDGRVFLTATHAGPGFGDAGQCGVWSWRPGTTDLRPESLLWWERDGRVVGDHAAHLVRDGDRWLVATSTWGDFDRTRVAVTVAESTADLLRGEHVLTGRELDLPTRGLGPTVATWDPHLAVIGGHWHISFVAARKFFDFRPAIARAVTGGRDGLGGPLELLGSAEDRHATEGGVLTRLDGRWVLLASDGADNPRSLRERYPVFDLAMREIGVVDAPYGSNIPWPMVIHHDRPEGPGWSMITFDGTPYGGELTGYGTHGDVLVMHTG